VRRTMRSMLSSSRADVDALAAVVMRSAKCGSLRGQHVAGSITHSMLTMAGAASAKWARTRYRTDLSESDDG